MFAPAQRGPGSSRHYQQRGSGSKVSVGNAAAKTSKPGAGRQPLYDFKAGMIQVCGQDKRFAPSLGSQVHQQVSVRIAFDWQIMLGTNFFDFLANRMLVIRRRRVLHQASGEIRK
jgi:hypothetical protein